MTAIMDDLFSYAATRQIGFCFLVCFISSHYCIFFLSFLLDANKCMSVLLVF